MLQDVENTRGRDRVAVGQRNMRNAALSDVFCSQKIFYNLVLLHPDDGGTTVCRNVYNC